MRSRSLVALRHVPFEGLDSFETLLSHADFAIEYIDIPCTDLRDDEIVTPDLVVVLGGPIAAYDEARFPFVQRECALIADRLASRKPTLGICLGSQLIARALGARVFSGDEKEIGWGALSLSEAGAMSALRHLDGALTPVLHWHGDTFDVPPGASLLASTPRYPNQAFSWGGCALGLQFHPEVTARALEAWYVGHAVELAIEHIDIPSLRLESRAYASQLASYAELFLHAWLSEMGF